LFNETTWYCKENPDINYVTGEETFCRCEDKNVSGECEDYKTKNKGVAWYSTVGFVIPQEPEKRSVKFDRTNAERSNHGNY
jgi:hypothetical protein